MFDEPDSPVLAAADTKGNHAMTVASSAKVICVLALIAIWCAATSYCAYKKVSEMELIRPQMLALAEQGRPEAVLWLMDHPGKGDVQKLDALRAAAETAHPESMYRYSVSLAYAGSHEESYLWLRKSAEQGFPAAVIALHKKAEKISQ